jgi:hypothetical protein
MARVLPNPAWVKPGATAPHNYNATKHTSNDSQRSYSSQARKNGLTIGDLLEKCKYERMRRALCDVQVK